MHISKNILDLNKTLESMEKIYSPKYGLANMITTQDLDHINISDNSNVYTIGNVIPMFNTQVKNTNCTTWDGGGVALTRKKSLVKAYGEFIERYCGNNSENNHDIDIIFDSYINLKSKANCLDFTDLIHFDDDLYDEPGFLYSNYTKDKTLSWVKGKDFIDGKDIWLPAQKVFLGIKLLRGERPHITWLSTGLACGKDYHRATLSALYEVVERDSFMLTWQLKLPGKLVIVDHIQNQELSDLYKHICSHLVGDDFLFIYDISRTEGIYTFLTFIRNDNPDSFGLITSAASDISAEKALLKSLEELCQTQLAAYTELIKNKKQCQALEKEEITDLFKHTLYYSTGRRSHEFDFISKSDCQVQLSDMKDLFEGSDKEALEYLKNLFKEKNQPVFIADVTRNEIRECGFCVVRAIVSGYNDLEYSHQIRLLKNKRLRKYQKKYNTSINDAPHPFP